MPQKVDLHIRAREPEKQEIIQERIISPQAQREYGESVQQEVTLHRERSFATRSGSVSSMKRLPDMPAFEQGGSLATTTSTKIRKSLAPSFTGRERGEPTDSNVYGGMEEDRDRCLSRQSESETVLDYRSDSRQSELSGHDALCESRQTISSASTFARPASRGHHQQMPSVSVSNAHSGTSHSTCSKNIRSCWSPETVPSEYTHESDYPDEEMDRGDEGDDTIHAAPVPEIRRTSGVFTRAPRAESIYQR